MQISHLPIGGAILATLALIWFIVNRETGFGSIGTFLFSTASYGFGWICTFIVLLVLVSRGGCDWIPGGAALRYLVVSTLHVVAGVICAMVIIEISDSRGDWWAWACFALATLVPVLIQIAALTVPALQRVLLMTVIGLQCAAAVTAPFVVSHRAAEKERATVRGESYEIDGLPDTVSIAVYAHYINGRHEAGIPERAARKVAARADHTALIVEALHGAYRRDAMRLLAVKGIPPSRELAGAVVDAIAVATQDAISGYETDTQAEVIGDVTEQYGAYSGQLIPALEKFVGATEDSPGRRHIQEWLVRAKGTR